MGNVLNFEPVGSTPNMRKVSDSFDKPVVGPSLAAIVFGVPLAALALNLGSKLLSNIEVSDIQNTFNNRPSVSQSIFNYSTKPQKNQVLETGYRRLPITFNDTKQDMTHYLTISPDCSTMKFAEFDEKATHEVITQLAANRNDFTRQSYQANGYSRPLIGYKEGVENLLDQVQDIEVCNRYDKLIDARLKK